LRVPGVSLSAAISTLGTRLVNSRGTIRIEVPLPRCPIVIGRCSPRSRCGPRQSRTIHRNGQ